MKNKVIHSINFQFELENIKGTVNNMLIPHRWNKNKWIYSRSYAQHKKSILEFLKNNYKDYENSLEKYKDNFISVRYVIFDKWLTKSSKYKKLRKKDIGNYIKNTEDVLFSFLGIDDKNIIRAHLEKGIIEPDETATYFINIDVLHEASQLIKRQDVLQYTQKQDLE